MLRLVRLICCDWDCCVIIASVLILVLIDCIVVCGFTCIWLLVY